MVKRTKYLLFIQEKTLLLVEPFIWGKVRFIRILKDKIERNYSPDFVSKNAGALIPQRLKDFRIISLAAAIPELHVTINVLQNYFFIS